MYRVVVGASTREEVLLNLGPPMRHMAADRIFVYSWEEVFAWVLVPETAGAPLSRPRFLAIEFDAAGRVRRRDVLPGDDRDASLGRWLQGSDPAVRDAL